MAESFREDDFLVPSLDKRHDVKHVKRAWNPNSVVWASFLVGPFGGSFLVLLNNGNLRLRNWRWCVPGVVTAVVLILIGCASVFSTAFAEIPSSIWLVGSRLMWVGLVYWATRPQAVRFAIYEHEDGNVQSVIWFGLGAFVVNRILSKGLVLVMTFVLQGLA